MSEQDRWMVKEAKGWFVPCRLSWCESGAIRKFVKAQFGGDSDIELWWEIFTESHGCRCVKVKIEEMVAPYIDSNSVIDTNDVPNSNRIHYSNTETNGTAKTDYSGAQGNHDRRPQPTRKCETTGDGVNTAWRISHGLSRS